MVFRQKQYKLPQPVKLGSVNEQLFEDLNQCAEEFGRNTDLVEGLSWDIHPTRNKISIGRTEYTLGDDAYDKIQSAVDPVLDAARGWLPKRSKLMGYYRRQVVVPGHRMDVGGDWHTDLLPQGVGYIGIIAFNAVPTDFIAATFNTRSEYIACLDAIFGNEYARGLEVDSESVEDLVTRGIVKVDNTAIKPYEIGGMHSDMVHRPGLNELGYPVLRHILQIETVE